MTASAIMVKIIAGREHAEVVESDGTVTYYSLYPDHMRAIREGVLEHLPRRCSDGGILAEIQALTNLTSNEKK